MHVYLQGVAFIGLIRFSNEITPGKFNKQQRLYNLSAYTTTQNSFSNLPTWQNGN